MRQRWASTDAQSNKRDRTPKTKRTPKDQAVSTPKTMASRARNVCTEILSPLVGDGYVHKSSSEEASPTNSNGPDLEESKTLEPDIEEGIQETDTGVRSVEESKSQETEINIQSSSSSSHQPVCTRTRLRSTSREREARLASQSQVVTRSRSGSAERVNTPATTPQATPHNLNPNIRGRQRPNSGRGRGRPKNNKRPDFR